MTTRAFTLIETILYLTLFSFIMTGSILAIYSTFASNDAISTAEQSEEEGLFVLQKIEWVLARTATTDAPRSGYAEALSANLADGTNVRISRVGPTLYLARNDDDPVALTSSQVVVEHLGFLILPGSPSGIEASTTIDGASHIIRRYYRTTP